VTRGILAAVFSLCFLGFLALWAPFSALVAALDLQGRGITYSRAEGSLWNGRLTGLMWRGHGLGDASVQVSPFLLLLGRLDIDIALAGRGVIAGRGHVTLWPNSSTTVRDLVLAADVTTLPVVLPLKGSVSVAVRRVEMTRHGCRSADADIHTNALVDRPAGLDWRGPVLSGAVRCAEGALIIPLAGDNGAETIAATMRLLADGSFSIQVDAHTADEAVIGVLSAIGFTHTDGRMTLMQAGRWS